MRGIIMKKTKIYTICVICCMLILCLMGCSSKDTIVGTWQKVDDSKRKISFYEDGNCKDIPYKTVTSADVEAYTLEEDGTIIFDMEWDGPITVKKTDDENEALESRSYYYLSKDKLVLAKKVYERQK